MRKIKTRERIGDEEASEEERSRERTETKVKKRALELSGKAAVEKRG